MPTFCALWSYWQAASLSPQQNLRPWSSSPSSPSWPCFQKNKASSSLSSGLYVIFKDIIWDKGRSTFGQYQAPSLQLPSSPSYACGSLDSLTQHSKQETTPEQHFPTVSTGLPPSSTTGLFMPFSSSGPNGSALTGPSPVFQCWILANQIFDSCRLFYLAVSLFLLLWRLSKTLAKQGKWLQWQ